MEEERNLEQARELGREGLRMEERMGEDKRGRGWGLIWIVG